MRVFIAGATGVLGRRLVERCVDRGHDVVGLTRDDRGDAVVRRHGGDPHRGDVLEVDSLASGAADADVVVHAATKVPTGTSPTEADWRRNDRVRREGARNLLTVAARADADRFLQQSVVWLARRPDGRRFDEHTAPSPDRTTQSALDAERVVMDAAEEHGIEPVVLRGGWFYLKSGAKAPPQGATQGAKRPSSAVGRGYSAVIVSHTPCNDRPTGPPTRLSAPTMCLHRTWNSSQLTATKSWTET
jgi:nucleoside-diphosphate-sugar epimerase